MYINLQEKEVNMLLHTGKVIKFSLAIVQANIYKLHSSWDVSGSGGLTTSVQLFLLQVPYFYGSYWIAGVAL